jgi:hypothetical protein
MSDIRLFAGLLTAFVIASGGMAFIIHEKQNVNIDTFNFGIDITDVYYSQNFTSNNTYNEDLISHGTFFANEFSGNWVQSDIGYTLQSPPNTIYFGYAQILFKNVMKDSNGNYDTTYQINNSVHGEYVIYIRKTNNQLSFADNIEVKIASDGIHLSQFDILSPLGYDKGFYPSTTIINEDFATIRTVFNPELKIVDVYYNDILLISGMNMNELSILSIGAFYYGGVGSKTDGFTLVATPYILISRTPITANNSGIDNVVSFLFTFGALLIWNVSEENLPWIFNIILIKIPEIALFVWGLALLRAA